MSLYKTIEIPNGDIWVMHRIFKCDICGQEIDESWRKYENGNYHLCVECAFRQGHFNGKEYLECCGISLNSVHAGINPNNEIEVWKGKPTPPWERESQQQRNSPKYKKWRTKIFERDGYTCRKCGQKGGELNAHHIKSFRKHKTLRYNVDNGITLCIECHREIHKQEGCK